MAHPKVTKVVLSMKPTLTFSQLGDELACQSDVSVGEPLREEPIIAVQRQMRDFSEKTAKTVFFVSFEGKYIKRLSNIYRGSRIPYIFSKGRSLWAGKSKETKFFLKTTISCIRSNLIITSMLCLQLHGQLIWKRWCFFVFFFPRATPRLTFL